MSPEAEAVTASWGAACVFWGSIIAVAKIQDLTPPWYVFLVASLLSWWVTGKVGKHIYAARMAEES